MGNKTSTPKKTQLQPQSDSILNNHIQNSNYNSTNKENLVNRLDRQTLQEIKRDFIDNSELFVLNNVIMAIMFFDSYSQYTENLKKELLQKDDRYIVPDKILEKVSENVLYRPHHGDNKDHSEPLVPKRLFVLNDWVDVLGVTEEAEDDSEKTTVRMEESRAKGYVRLRTINSTFQHTTSSPILRLDSTEPQSRESEDSSEGYYSDIQELKTPKPIEIIQGLERHERRTSENSFLQTCISYRKIKKLTWNPDEFLGEAISEEDLYETVSYVNSKSFMKHLENDLYLNGVASELGFDIEDIAQSESKHEKISCMVKVDNKTVPYEIMPSLQASWPLEQTLKFTMKSDRMPEGRKRYVFPTNYMVKQITSLHCVLLPKGKLKKRNERKDADIEWELAFPQAQRFLEAFMSHAQMKSLLILLTLHKTYIEPKTSDSGLLPEHIRNFILGECESNFSEWPEHRLGIKLLQVIKNLNNLLSKPRPNIPHFFINDKNTLSDISTPKIRQAQKAFDEILQTPLMSFIRALRNLRYTNGKTFFPPFDFKKLNEILIKSGIEYSNPQMMKNVKRKNDDLEHAFDRFTDGKRREAILKKREEEEQRKKEEAKNLNVKERRYSVDSIGMDLNIDYSFNIQKKRAILKFFIETFLDISEKCLKISTKSNTLFYIKQAYYLTRILRDESAAFADEAGEYLLKINDLQDQCDRMNVNNKISNGIPKSVEPQQRTLVSCTENDGTKNVASEQKLAPRKTVAFIEVHKAST